MLIKEKVKISMSRFFGLACYVIKINSTITWHSFSFFMEEGGGGRGVK